MCNMQKIESFRDAVAAGEIVDGLQWCQDGWHWLAEAPEIYGFRRLVPSVIKRCPSCHEAEKGVEMKTFASFDASLQPYGFDLARKFATEKEWRTIILSGSTGTGKTHLAQAICYELSGSCVTAGELARVARDAEAGDPDDRQEARRKLRQWVQVDTLAIDDLGAERHTGSDLFPEVVYTLLEERSKLKNKRTVVTTNLSSQEISQRYGEKVYSRLMFEAKAAKMVGTDFRVAKSRCK